MILVISDVHGQFRVINEQIDFAEARLGKEVAAVVVLGDLGLFEVNLRRFFIRDKQRFKRPLYFIEGNHEDFAAFDGLMNKYGGFFTHFARGTVQCVAGHSFLCLGGARYMDLLNTPMRSEIRDRDIDACLSHPPGSLKIIFSHDCPSGIGVPNTPGLEFYGRPGIARSAELVERYAPALWVFGHHHKWFFARHGGTAFHGLPESWKGFGILGEGGEFTTFENPVETAREPFWKRWFRNF